MWPWGHLAAGYLCYRAIARDRSLAAGPIFALALGTQLPDLIDKPLAWTVTLLPNGRSLGHSLVVAVPVLVGIALVVDQHRRQAAFALTVGYLTHLGTDALYPALAGDWYYVGFLGWPIVPPIAYADEPAGIVAHLIGFELTLTSGFELLLVGAAAVLWLADQKPGWDATRRVLRDAVEM